MGKNDVRPVRPASRSACGPYLAKQGIFSVNDPHSYRPHQPAQCLTFLTLSRMLIDNHNTQSLHPIRTTTILLTSVPLSPGQRGSATTHLPASEHVA